MNRYCYRIMYGTSRRPCRVSKVKNFKPYLEVAFIALSSSHFDIRHSQQH